MDEPIQLGALKNGHNCPKASWIQRRRYFSRLLLLMAKQNKILIDQSKHFKSENWPLKSARNV